MLEAQDTIHPPRLRGHLPFKPAAVYVLVDPRDDAVRYVGVTTKTLHRRCVEHCAAARRGDRGYAYAWLRQVLEAGLRPRIECVETVAPGGDWPEAERRWIRLYRERGARLANLTDGGDGVPGRRNTPEQLARLIASLKGRKCSEQARSNMKAAAKRRPIPAGFLANIGKTFKGKRHTDAARAAMSRTKKNRGLIPWMKGKAHRPDSIEKLRAAKIDNPNITTKFRARAVIVKGIEYSSMSAAARALGVLQRDINYWIRRGRAFYADGNNPVVPRPGRIGRPPKPRPAEQTSFSF